VVKKLNIRDPAVTDTMSLTPVSRQEMREAKAKAEEGARLQVINTIVSEIYTAAVKKAKGSSERSYTYPLTNTTYHNYGTLTSKSVQAAMPDIITRLEDLFPGCAVTHAEFAKGQDGKLYGISTMEEKVLAFVNKQELQEYIVVDWS
jgi:hypothetical protein